MKRIFAIAVGALAAMLGSAQTFASCWADGITEQTVWMSSEGKHLERWKPVSGEIHRSRLPNGFELGIQIEPATAEKYREALAKSRGVDELVKISLYDMSGAAPTLLSTTWGGANSSQGFGPRGGANGVPVMGQQIELWFHKPVCVTAETLATQR